MTTVAHLSDPHLTTGPGDAAAARALQAAVDAVLGLQPAPDALLLTGDVAEHGAPAEYARAREALAPLPMPLHVLPGNLDDRDAMRAAFGLPGTDGERIRYCVRCGTLRVVACDTLIPGRDDGCLDDEHRAWLDAELAAEPRTPTIVAMHHPPIDIGISAFDEIGIPATDRAALGALLDRHGHVRRIVAGHVHRTVFGVLGPCGVVTAPSTHLRSALEIGGHMIRLAPGIAGFALHVDIGGEIATHVEPLG